MIFNDNRESWRTALIGRDSLFLYALRSHFRRRRAWPRRSPATPSLACAPPPRSIAWLSNA